MGDKGCRLEGETEDIVPPKGDGKRRKSKAKLSPEQTAHNRGRSESKVGKRLGGIQRSTRGSRGHE